MGWVSDYPFSHSRREGRGHSLRPTPVPPPVTGYGVNDVKDTQGVMMDLPTATQPFRENKADAERGCVDDMAGEAGFVSNLLVATK
jgi:hypothetical protein